jgi:hypothetical protein
MKRGIGGDVEDYDRTGMVSFKDVPQACNKNSARRTHERPNAHELVSDRRDQRKRQQSMNDEQRRPKVAGEIAIAESTG